MYLLENHPLNRKHTIDSAMNSLWDFYKARFLSLFFISLGMSLIIQYASTYIDIKEIQEITDPMLMLEKFKEIVVPMTILLIINIILSAILQHYILFNPVDSSVNIFVSIKRTVRYLIPLFIIMIILGLVASLAIVIGIIALVIGVVFSIIYIATLYFFILPVLFVEGPDIGTTITKTITYAHRNFWSNIGWVSVFLILVIVISLILSGIILLPFTGSFLKTIYNPEEATDIVDITTKPLFIILSAVVNALTLPLIPIFASILYFNSRAGGMEKEKTKTAAEDGKIRVEDLYAKPYSDDHPENPENK
jgi:hypothetical protein